MSSPAPPLDTPDPAPPPPAGPVVPAPAPPAPLSADYRPLIAGYLAVALGFAGTLAAPSIASVLLGHLAIAAAMLLMLGGLALVVLAVVRNTMRGH